MINKIAIPAIMVFISTCSVNAYEERYQWEKAGFIGDKILTADRIKSKVTKLPCKVVQSSISIGSDERFKKIITSNGTQYYHNTKDERIFVCDNGDMYEWWWRIKEKKYCSVNESGVHCNNKIPVKIMKFMKIGEVK